METPLDELRAALRAYQKREGISQNEHARRLGITAAYLSDFLQGQRGLGSRLLRAIRVLHPDLLHILLRWMAEGSETRQEAGTATKGPPG